MKITTADGAPLPTEGCYEAEIWMEGKWRRGAFFVMRELTSDVLLGIDFIRFHELSYNARKHAVHAEEEEGLLKLAKKTRIPAGAIAMVRTRCAGLQVRQDEVVIASVSSHEVPICGTDMIIKGENGEYYIMIDNVMDVEMVIPRGTVVGAVETVPQKACKRLELKEEDTPKERGPPKGKCDPEKESMLREVIGEQMSVLDPKTGAEYLEAILANHDVFSRDKSDLGRTDVMEHKIRLKQDDPAYSKQFRIPEEHRSILIEHLQNWLKLGVVSPCRSTWNSPIFLVPKKDGTMRPVLDFRQVNSRSHVDKYSQREIQDCLDEIGRSKSTVFSSLDLTAGFWQLPLEKEVGLTRHS